MTMQTVFTLGAFYSLALFVPLALVLMYIRPQLWPWLFAIFLGMLTAWLDAGASEVLPIILLLFAFGAFLGFARPEKPWRWALLLGIWVPLGWLLAAALGIRDWKKIELIGAAVPFIPALAGSYLGALVHRAGEKVPAM